MCEIKKIIIIAMAVGILFTGFAALTCAQPPAEDVTLMKRRVKALHEGNAEALSALYTPDAVYVHWAGPFRLEGEKRSGLGMQLSSEPFRRDLLSRGIAPYR